MTKYCVSTEKGTINFAEVGQEESSWRRGYLNQETKDKPTYPVLSKGAASGRNRKHAVFGEHGVIWCGRMLGKMIGGGREGGQMGDRWNPVHCAKGKQPILFVFTSY